MYSGVVYTICWGINKSEFRPELHLSVRRTREGTYCNVTLRRVRVTIVAVEKQ